MYAESFLQCKEVVFAVEAVLAVAEVP